MNLNNFIHSVIKNLKEDNKLPFVKTEVVYDTFLFPEVLTTLLMQEGIEAKYITKEFPIDKQYLNLNKEEKGYISVDYLLVNHKERMFYLVELKTTNGSFDYEQLRRYTIAMDKFSFILNEYTKADPSYARDKAYSAQRVAVRNALPDYTNDIYKDYNVTLVYIIPGFVRAKDVVDRVNQSVNMCKNKEYYLDIQSRMQNKLIKTISLNKLIANKKEEDFNEKNVLDQFLYIWLKTSQN